MVGLIGAGVMGEAIIKGVLESGYSASSLIFYEISKTRREYIKSTYSVKDASALEELTENSKYLIVAVKPQDGGSVLQKVSSILSDRHVLTSIMAGFSISRISSFLGKPSKIIRVMPNICISVRQGIIGMTRNDFVLDDEYRFMFDFFSRLGTALEVKEELFDAFTACAGSGPAFFLLFLEGMIDAGVKLGFSREDSKRIAYKVVEGTLSMLNSEGTHPTVLKEKITSPGGTTIFGLSILESRATKGAIIEALEAARNRAGELSK